MSGIFYCDTALFHSLYHGVMLESAAAILQIWEDILTTQKITQQKDHGNLGFNNIFKPLV